MRFDSHFYIQRNRDNSNSIIDLDNSENCRMKGTKEHPVKKIGRIEAVEIDYQILQIPLKSLNKISLKLILSDPCSFIKKDLSYYMQFLFYDFYRVTYLFLFNAKVTEFGYIPRHGNESKGLLVLSIVSTRYDETPVYRTFEIEHKKI